MKVRQTQNNSNLIPYHANSKLENKNSNFYYIH